LPLVAPTAQEYSRLCFRSSVHYARDAVVAFTGRRYASALISCQHAWEMSGKAALGIEAGYAWPPPGKNWMTSHHLIYDVRTKCLRLALPPLVERALNRLELWLPPHGRSLNPPRNTEYFFDAGSTWAIPAQSFTRSDARSAVRGIIRTLRLVRAAYDAELKGLPSTMPSI
jgi:hypothetical protein